MHPGSLHATIRVVAWALVSAGVGILGGLLAGSPTVTALVIMIGASGYVLVLLTQL